MIVKSIAGHDKNIFHLVIDVAGNRAKIVDGKYRKLKFPKSKNVIHLSCTKHSVDLSLYLTDKSIRALLHPYNHSGGDFN